MGVAYFQLVELECLAGCSLESHTLHWYVLLVCAVHCIFSVPVRVRQGPPENQLSAEEASLLK